jgi:hypothetical protein
LKGDQQPSVVVTLEELPCLCFYLPIIIFEALLNANHESTKQTQSRNHARYCVRESNSNAIILLLRSGVETRYAYKHVKYAPMSSQDCAELNPAFPELSNLRTTISVLPFVIGQEALARRAV